MCMLYIKEAGIVIPRVFWDSICAANREGMGMFNIDKNEIVKTEDYEEAWRYVNDNKQDKIVCHHRLATSGAKTIDQLHGWDMENGYVFFHNGVLKTYRGTATMSDTQQFVEEWKGAPVRAMVRYLEAMEKSSRFLLIHRESDEIIKPDCARWNPVYIHELGKTVEWSNDYAFKYNLLPSAYSRWSGYDDDWSYGGGNTRYFNSSSTTTKKQRTTRSGAKTTKRVESIFEQSLKVNDAESIELKGVTAFDSKKNVHVNQDLGLEFLSELKNITGTTNLYRMPDIARLIGTSSYVMGADLVAKIKDDKHVITMLDNEYADVITMNDVMDCGSADITKAFVRIARTSDEIKYSNKEVKNTALYKYIRSYELRIGSRKDNALALSQFLQLACAVECIYDAEKRVTLDEMTAASCFVEALAEELTVSGEFKYFGAFSKRVLKKFIADFEEEVLLEVEALEEAAKERKLLGGNLGKWDSGVTTGYQRTTGNGILFY